MCVATTLISSTPCSLCCLFGYKLPPSKLFVMACSGIGVYEFDKQRMVNLSTHIVNCGCCSCQQSCRLRCWSGLLHPLPVSPLPGYAAEGAKGRCVCACSATRYCRRAPTLEASGHAKHMKLVWRRWRRAGVPNVGHARAAQPGPLPYAGRNEDAGSLGVQGLPQPPAQGYATSSLTLLAQP